MTAMIPLTVTDDEEAGFTFSIPLYSTLPSLVEGGSSTTFNVQLQARPLTSVTVTVESTNTGAATVSPSLLTYTNSNWNDDQTVTIAPRAANSANDPDTNYRIELRYLDGDPAFALGRTYSFSGVIKDNAGFVLQPLGLDVEEGGSSTFTARLDQEPTTPVTLTVLSSSSQISVDPAQLIFTDSDWQDIANYPQSPRDDNNMLSNLDYVVSVSVAARFRPCLLVDYLS